ncbi:LysR substrate-binding domain-containing protein [Undibacterium sp. TS12]|uniref:LysR substrate-binding domain-containing protein n=1 Tax=Undibacterium sp. TS12 TaxID=2908202 RepID=UPI001F4CF3BB|nr:LysR substrate-binding domain-containing protein [Undibacterium sp. TS12]MCH8620248.1 LysR substrate-binding domain-containing protein [Undibacterium sp. TS12]
MNMKINILDIRKLDFNLCVVFLALWQERSVTKAASRLALSQAATSAALARLRQTCGDSLFVRTNGGMEPTPRALAMVEQLESGVAHLWEVLKQPQTFDPSTTTRNFSIGMSDDFELAIGPNLSRLVREEGPNVSLIFRQTNSHTVEQKLNDREIELAVVSGAASRAWITQEQIGNAGYACLVDADAIDVALPLSVDDYVRLPHILVSFSGRSGIVDTALNAIGKQRYVYTALTHFSAVPAFLVGTRAVVTLPSHAAAALSHMSQLTTCPAPLDLDQYPVQLLSRRDSKEDPAVNWMKHKIRIATEIAMKASTNVMGNCGFPPHQRTRTHEV